MASKIINAVKPVKPLPVKTETVPPVTKFLRPELTIKGDTLKKCPNCSAPSTGPYYDKHFNIRCSCSDKKCAYWDSQVYLTEKAAAEGWEASGGKDTTYR